MGGATGSANSAITKIVSEVQEDQIARELSLVGSVQPRHSSLVAAETEGKVVRRFKEGGESVRVGEIIFRLGNDLLVAPLVEALADVKYRKSEFQQHEELLKQEAVAENVVREAEYELDRARAKLQDLRHRLDDPALRSPFDGHIIQTFKEVGEWVSHAFCYSDYQGQDEMVLAAQPVLERLAGEG